MTLLSDVTCLAWNVTSDLTVSSLNTGIRTRQILAGLVYNLLMRLPNCTQLHVFLFVRLCACVCVSVRKCVCIYQLTLFIFGYYFYTFVQKTCYNWTCCRLPVVFPCFYSRIRIYIHTWSSLVCRRENPANDGSNWKKI